MVMLLEGALPGFINSIVYVFVVVLVLAHVRLLSDPPLLEPSIIMYLQPFMIRMAVVEDPVMTGVLAAPGLIVTVFAKLVPVTIPIVIGNVSDGYVLSVNMNVTGQDTPLEFRSVIAAVKVV